MQIASTMIKLGEAMKRIKNILTQESGATSVEYALLLAVLAGVMIATAFAGEGVSSTTWQGNAEAINRAIN